jgi:serine/threonine protein kinase
MESSSVSWDLPAGSTFAGYRITGVIGRGGMSIVYEAEHVQLGRTLALKLLAPSLAMDESFRERFIRESRIAASLDHPNVVQIYDAGESDGVLYIAMRHIAGTDVRTLLQQKGPLGLGQTLFILEQVASALDAAHERGLVHRDIKPANILVAQPSERAFLTDFGVAKEITGRGLTKTGYFIGTFEYAAPEQIEGKTVDGRTDLYALGCVLYECLSGEAPFGAETEGSIIHAHLVEPPPKLTAKRPDLPPGLNAVITQAMAKSKDDRYATAGDMVSAVRAVALEGSGAPATSPARPVSIPPAAPETILAPSEPPAPAESVAPAAPPPPAPPPREPRTVEMTMRRLALVGAGLLLLLVAAVVAAVLLAGGDDSSTSPGAVPPTSPPTAPPPPAQPAAAPAGVASLVDRTIFRDCEIDKTPALGSVESASCGPPRSPSQRTLPFYPDSWQVAVYPDSASLKAAYDQLRQEHDIGMNFGRCNGTAWGGEGQWAHGPQKPGGRRFCYFEGNVAVMVWTHEKLGQGSHIDTLGTARAGGSDHAGLFNWWRFWHHRIGKCPQTDCVAKLQ